MENQEILINPKYHNVLIFASTDKDLTSNQFRTLFFISTNIDNIYVEDMKQKLNFKTSNLMSDTIKALIKNGYITRYRNRKVIKKGFPFYCYEINQNKALFSNNLNSLIFDNYNENIDYIFKYFFKKIPTKRKIDLAVNRKATELLIYKDDVSIEDIKTVIDYVSNTKYKLTINRPLLLRKNFKALKKEIDELSNKSN